MQPRVPCKCFGSQSQPCDTKCMRTEINTQNPTHPPHAPHPHPPPPHTHTRRYWYYLLCSLGRPPAWKRLVTRVQIFQFFSSFALSVPFWVAAARAPGCSGLAAMGFNAVFNAALLWLFVDFSRRSYKKSKGARGAAGKAE